MPAIRGRRENDCDVHCHITTRRCHRNSVDHRFTEEWTLLLGAAAGAVAGAVAGAAVAAAAAQSLVELLGPMVLDASEFEHELHQPPRHERLQRHTSRLQH